jgi:predicted acylesterase/phospholipase RssA
MMAARTQLGILAAALALAHPALGSDCQGASNTVVNVGLPHARFVDNEQIDRGKIVANLTPLFANKAQLACPAEIQANVAVGTDYQILDWMGRGLIDAAVVSELSLDLLTSDGIELLEIGLPETQRAEVLPLRVAVLHARGPGTSQVDPEQALDEALGRIWTVASETGARQPIRFVFTSHLSTIGFLVPIVEIQRWLDSRSKQAASQDSGALRERFWAALFDHSCFHFGEPQRCRGTDEASEFEFVPALPDDRDHRETFRNHLVMRADLARRLFAERALSRPRPSPLAGEMRELIATAGAEAARPTHDVARPFESHAAPQKYFGTRTFAFTLDETLRMLDLNRQMAGARSLALVLPGGGVKAAFQSRVVDELYREKRLANGDPAAAPAGRSPMQVDYVVGTSGGALLGYFVARLGENGPFDLADILWYRVLENGDKTRLSNADLFPDTDLPRYASLVAVLIVLCVVLRAAAELPHSWLASPRPAGQTSAKPVVGRIGLLVVLAAVVAIAPFLVRRLSGAVVVEQVAQIAGLLFAATLVVVMFADQCLIFRADRDEQDWPLGRSAFVLALGVLFMFGPLVAGPAMQETVYAGTAFVLLICVGYVAALAYLRRSGAVATKGQILRVALGALLGAIGALWLDHLAPGWLLSYVDDQPMFNLFLSLFVPFLIAALLRPPADPSQPVNKLRRAVDRVVARLPRFALPLLVSLVASLVAWDLSRPPPDPGADSSLWQQLWLPSQLEASNGALLASLGALLSCFGVVLFLHDKPNRFRLEGTDLFRSAVFLLVLPLGAFVFFALWAIAKLPSQPLTLFELTPAFWLGLVVVSVLASAALVGASWPRWQRVPLSSWLRETLAYLMSAHPNGRFVVTRQWRLLVVAFVGLFWWNFVIAPGLYGNRPASRYMGKVDQRFIEAFEAAHPGGASSAPLTTRLMVTANVLNKDEKRLVVAVGAGQPCPSMPRGHGGGITWYRFRSGGPPEQGDDGCDVLDFTRAADREHLRSFIFASGSPFPIFPAMRVQSRSAGSVMEPLVDGGFSNNTPLEVAAMAGAEQALIVNSSHPIGCRSGEALLADAPGPLVSGVLRLPSFLFERAQQADRRSRESMFVASLSPACRSDWPGLADFTSETIERVLSAADEDLGHRIGMVESWGAPRFQASLYR